MHFQCLPKTPSVMRHITAGCQAAQHPVRPGCQVHMQSQRGTSLFLHMQWSIAATSPRAALQEPVADISFGRCLCYPKTCMTAWKILTIRRSMIERGQGSSWTNLLFSELKQPARLLARSVSVRWNALNSLEIRKSQRQRLHASTNHMGRPRQLRKRGGGGGGRTAGSAHAWTINIVKHYIQLALALSDLAQKFICV